MAFASDPLTWIFSGAQKELELRMNDPEAYEIYMENKYNPPPKKPGWWSSGIKGWLFGAGESVPVAQDISRYLEEFDEYSATTTSHTEGTCTDTEVSATAFAYDGSRREDGQGFLRVSDSSRVGQGLALLQVGDGGRDSSNSLSDDEDVPNDNRPHPSHPTRTTRHVLRNHGDAKNAGNFNKDSAVVNGDVRVENNYHIVNLYSKTGSGHDYDYTRSQISSLSPSGRGKKGLSCIMEGLPKISVDSLESGQSDQPPVSTQSSLASFLRSPSQVGLPSQPNTYNEHPTILHSPGSIITPAPPVSHRPILHSERKRYVMTGCGSLAPSTTNYTFKALFRKGTPPHIIEYCKVLRKAVGAHALIALWSPAPYKDHSCPQGRPITLDDVGFMNEKGGFQSLFNVFMEAQDNATHGYPHIPVEFQHFRRLLNTDIQYQDSTTAYESPMPPGRPFVAYSDSVDVQEFVQDDDMKTIPWKYRFTVAPNDYGAALIAPEGASRSSLHPDLVEELAGIYLPEKARHWLNDWNDDGNALDLILVTETHMASSWGAMSYQKVNRGKGPVEATAVLTNPGVLSCDWCKVGQGIVKRSMSIPAGSAGSHENNLCVAISGIVLQHQKARVSAPREGSESSRYSVASHWESIKSKASVASSKVGRMISIAPSRRSNNPKPACITSPS